MMASNRNATQTVQVVGVEGMNTVVVEAVGVAVAVLFAMTAIAAPL
jgi:hypothetical protein